ncbi:MAG TPA: M14 family metallocarboxypeptidase [Candidatus Hydrogenedentes bacterium]|nr:M14 family metallocarboxypeptidase [Candidatus Hydrogenedentota bacterium]
MAKWLIAVFVGAGLLRLGSCAVTSRHDYENASPVRNFDTIATRLEAAAAASERITLDSIGEVAYEGFAASIWRVRVEAVEEAKARVLLTGGVHGNEPAGTESLVRFIEDLAQTPEVYACVDFDIVPVVNPWGWVHNKRRNRDRCDLNRDFASFNAQESRIIRALARDRAYDAVVDLHEDGSARGFYLYRLDNPDEGLCRGIIERQRALGRPIEQHAWMVMLKTRDGILHAPHWTLVVARMAHQLSMTNWFRLGGCERSFVFETPSRRAMEDRVAMNTTGIECVLGRFGVLRP